MPRKPSESPPESLEELVPDPVPPKKKGPQTKASKARMSEAGRNWHRKPRPLDEGEKAHFKSLDAMFKERPGSRPTPDDEIIWVWNVFDDEEVSALAAPSRAAWSMLFMGRCDRIKFFTQIVQPAMKRIAERKDAVDARMGVGPEEFASIETIRADIRAAVKASQEMRLEDY